MRTRPIILSKTCPVCGARSRAEAQIPVPANIPAMEFNLDKLDTLVEKLGLSQLLALVELLPYKTFTCVKCQAEFRLESNSARAMIGAMLTSMQPVLPKSPPGKAAGRPKSPTAKRPVTPPTPAAAKAPEGKEWESESLDSLFDYSVDKKTDT